MKNNTNRQPEIEVEKVDKLIYSNGFNVFCSKTDVQIVFSQIIPYIGNGNSNKQKVKEFVRIVMCHDAAKALVQRLEENLSRCDDVEDENALKEAAPTTVHDK